MEKQSLNFMNPRYKIIDVQDRSMFNISHINGAINIPYDDLINNYRTYLNKNETYYLYCKSGKLSKRASIILNYLGYNTIVLEK
ncbi:MAG: rhodanese-like domain-containing protein [Bacilli bacterium]|nr:rhodanese-like domain-containing protein [Bacilli bacterium]